MSASAATAASTGRITADIALTSSRASSSLLLVRRSTRSGMKLDESSPPVNSSYTWLGSVFEKV